MFHTISYINFIHLNLIEMKGKDTRGYTYYPIRPQQGQATTLGIPFNPWIFLPNLQTTFGELQK